MSKRKNDKSRRGQRGTAVAKPKVALCEPGNIQPLVKDGKNHLAPLSQEQKDERYPGLDTLSTKKAAKALDLDKDFDMIPLDEAETDKQREAELTDKDNEKDKRGKKGRHSKKGKKGKRSKKAQKKRAKRIMRFCSMPGAMQNQKTGFLILFAAMLACVQGFLPMGLPLVHSIHLGAPLAVPAALMIILEAINGPETVEGSHCTLLRPFCLLPKRDSVASTAPSSSPYTYFGGEINDSIHGGKEFWLPLWNRAVIVGQGLPERIRNIAAKVPTVTPIYCDGTKKGTNGLELNADGLVVEDEKLLRSTGKHVLLINAAFRSFLQKLRAHPKKVKTIFNDVNNYLPERNAKGGGKYQPSLEDYLIAEGLCLYSGFIDYMICKKWLKKKTGEELFNEAMECLFPSDDQVKASDTGTVIGRWNSKDTFIRFLAGYLRANAGHINFNGKPCSADTVAAVHVLSKKHDKGQLLIMPYRATLDAYQKYLSEYGIDPEWTDASFYRAAKDWGIKGFKEGSRKDPWKHNFYEKSDLPERVSNSNINCFGFAIDTLPDEIKQILADLQAERNTDEKKEEVNNDA